MRLSPSPGNRHAAVVPLMAFLLIPLLGMMAYSVDIGWVTHTQNELQSAADAAALAGAATLTGDATLEGNTNLTGGNATLQNLVQQPNGWVTYYLPSQSAANQANILSTSESIAKIIAKKYAAYNTAGGVSLTLLDSDIEFGFTDASGNYQACPGYTGFPNTIKVTLRRDNNANGPLGLFFGPVIGTPSASLTATASATIYAGTVNDFQPNYTNPAWILPMTYDVNHWNNFLQGTNPDAITDANGNPEIQVYPSIKFTGNFGELSLDQGNDGASTISGWIGNGTPWSDLQNEYNANLLPLSAHDPNSAPDWKGNPGLKTSTIHTAQNNVGQTYLLPLFKPVNAGTPPDYSDYQAGSGNGSHYYYTIVQFVGIKIMPSNSGVVVEPTAVSVPQAVLTGVTVATPPPNGSTQLQTTFAAPKLTQ
jgi:hypothetical protein